MDWNYGAVLILFRKTNLKGKKEEKMCDCDLIKFVENPKKPAFLVIEENIARENNCPLLEGNNFAEFYRNDDRALEIARELNNVFG